MPTIIEKGPYTLIVEFEVDPTQQQQLIESIADVGEQAFRPDPRFISASFHASHDGQRVVNYAQWQSKEDYDAFMNSTRNTAQASIKEAILKCGAKPVYSNTYEVRRIVERTTV